MTFPFLDFPLKRLIVNPVPFITNFIQKNTLLVIIKQLFAIAEAYGSPIFKNVSAAEPK